MSTKTTGDTELSQFVPDHVFRDLNRLEILTVMDKESLSHELRTDGAGTRPRLDGFRGTRLDILLHFRMSRLFLLKSLFFLLGFLDDIKINIKPKIRLSLMIIILIVLAKYNNFYLEKTGIEVLNNWLMNSEIFSLIFICLCFLFIINGANLIDGYNGLLGFHSLIIIINLFFVNYLNGNNDLPNLLSYYNISGL